MRPSVKFEAGPWPRSRAEFAVKLGLMPVWRVDRIAHPALPLLVALDAVDDAVVYISLGARQHGLARYAARHNARLEVERRPRSEARAQLLEYLAAQRQTFHLRLRPLGTTFQRRAWVQLGEVPYGKTASYAQQAQALGMETGARAVGRANGFNPLPIVLPCHRIIGASGSMTGFSGGDGVETKRWLLRLEQNEAVPSWHPTDRTPATQLGLFG